MTKRVYRSRMVMAVLMIIMTVFCSQVISAEFSADMFDPGSGDTTIGKIYVKGLKYRMEKMEDGQSLVIIVNQEANMTQVINISEEAYIEMPCDDLRSLANDPFQSLKYTAAALDVTLKPAGTEMINGMECEKATLMMNGAGIMTQSVATKLEFPVRIVTHAQEDRIFELRNIKETTIEDGLFKIPEGFSNIESSQSQAVVQPEETAPLFPDWVANANSAELVTLPLERVMKAGDMIRIKVVAGKEIFAMGTNVQSGNSTFFAVPYKDGKPIDDSSVVFSEYGDSRMHNLMMEGIAWPATLTETPEQADEVIVCVEEGEVKMAIEYTGKP